MKLNKIKEKLEILKKDKSIIAVLLFGSYITNKPYARDIDICIVLDNKYTKKEIFNKLIKISGSMPDKFDIKIYQDLPLYIKKRILEKNKILFCKDEDRLYEIAMETLKDFNLFEKGYNYYMEGILNG